MFRSNSENYWSISTSIITIICSPSTSAIEAVIFISVTSNSTSVLRSVIIPHRTSPVSPVFWITGWILNMSPSQYIRRMRILSRFLSPYRLRLISLFLDSIKMLLIKPRIKFFFFIYFTILNHILIFIFEIRLLFICL